MKILFIVPGAGDSFYCGNCFRDNLQANALRNAGHDVIVMPLYLPLKDQSFLADTPLFFPATSYYVSQKYFKKRAMPHWVEKLLDSDFFLNIASSFSGTTSSEGMEDMTLSMINGEDVAFQQQAQTLIDWIQKDGKPDIIHLSSSLVIGIAKAIRQVLDIPLVCSLQDEEVWIDKLEKKYADTAWQGILENIQYVDCFIASSAFYKKTIEQRFPSIQNIQVVYPGLDTAKYASDHYPQDPVIGFFYRMNEENGLKILAEAFVKLKKKGGFDRVRLRIGGGYTSENKPFLKKIHQMLAPYQNTVDWCESYSLSEHARFYKEITAICVPVTFDEGVGLYLCEAFAAGRPAIEPATGSFPEIVGDAGVLYAPNSSDALATAIEKMLIDNELLNQCCKNALQLSATRYNQTIQAAELCKVYETVQNPKHSQKGVNS
jgi:glycosyltransferase involved in cell wall biosynthesis